MIPHTIKVALLELAHFIWYIYNRILFILVCLYYQLLSNIEQANKTCDYITYNHTIIKNIRTPSHIAMVFTNEMDYLNLDSIARLLCWCKQLGVEYITLYDELGKLKTRQADLLKCFEFRMRLLGCEKPISCIKGLNIISRPDGRPKFIDDIRELLKGDPESVNMTKVQNSVNWISDPELLINFGSPLCLRGFPAWQLRLTEIFSIPTHRNIPQRIFINCLKKYSRTNQREGV